MNCAAPPSKNVTSPDVGVQATVLAASTMQRSARSMGQRLQYRRLYTSSTVKVNRVRCVRRRCREGYIYITPNASRPGRGRHQTTLPHSVTVVSPRPAHRRPSVMIRECWYICTGESAHLESWVERVAWIAIHVVCLPILMLIQIFYHSIDFVLLYLQVQKKKNSRENLQHLRF